MIARIKRFHSQGLFESDLSKKNIGAQAVRGGVAVWGAEFLSFLLRIGSIAILARLLLPEDFGLLAMVTALTVFAERFKDFGLGDATVQAKDITRDQVSALFWINLGICLSIALFVGCMSTVIAWFYGDSRLTYITLVIGSTFVFSGIIIQHQALLRRNFQFRTLATIQISSITLSIIVAIIMAYMGFGYWALVGREFSRAAFVCIGTWISCPWVPNLPNRNVEVKQFVSFGKNITGFNLVHFFSRSVDKILIGKLYGPSMVGLYNNAHQFISLPISQIQFPVNTVALPALSALQTNPLGFRTYYQNMLRFVIFICMPVVVFLCIFADVLIPLLLGPKWIDAIPIFQVLTIGALIEPVIHTTGPAMVACGKSKEYFRLGLFNALSLVGCISFGSIWGTIGVAYGYSFGMYLACTICLAYGLKQTPVKIGPPLKQLILTLAISCSTGFCAVYIRYLLGWNIDMKSLLFILMGGGAFYFSIWVILPEGRKMLMEYYKYAKVFFKRA